MKIAVFGGSFNPVHLGHIEAARFLLQKGIAEEVWLVPCYKHAFKPEKALASFEHRMEMLQIAVAGEDFIKVLDIEKKHGINYTIDLLKILKKNFPMHDFLFVIGSDLVKEFTEWKDPGGIARLAKIVVMQSPLSQVLENEFINRKNCIFLKHSNYLPVSAKQIRKLVSEGESVSGMVEDEVEAYIVRKNVYGKKT